MIIMRPKHNLPLTVLSVFALLSLFAIHTSAQTNAAQPQITQAVDEAKLTVLHGNTHPLARAQFDRGAAPGNLATERMLLVLKRSPAQEAALEKFMAGQQDKSSPNYHKWLTPAEFGREFGAAGQDVQTITSWLESHGFQVAKPSDGRSVIEFSGNVAQVQGAFHTSIHKFVVNDVEHWANASDPSIPTALTPVVAGVRSLHNFFPQASNRVKAASARNQTSGNRTLTHSGVTFNGTTACALTAVTDCFGIGPADFGTIYNVLPLWNAGIDGTGETIAVVTDSNIAVEDAQEFRSMFGLPAKDPVVTLNGSDPGLLANGDEVEAILDVEWSGAVARNANINLVVSESTNTTFGGDLSSTFVVNETPAPSILSYSFGACELAIGSVGNAFYNSTWQQATTEGITVIVSTGDNGSASCDTTLPAPGDCGFSSSATVEVASCGLQVNGIASTPFDIAVGGTEFNDIANPLNFWSANNANVSLASALSYIPEMTYNDSCTEPAVYNFFFALGYLTADTAETACNNATVQEELFVSVAGGGGGMSNCITSDGNDLSSCTGGYAKPAWQVALTPADTKRDLPDVSLFAGDGTISGSFYIVCNRDFSGITGVCDLSTGNYLTVGGTSVSAQVFAGIMALVDQKNEAVQGNANLVIYPLAVASAPGSCNSAGPPASTCVFNDVSVGTIAMPCAAGTINCVVNTTGDPIGVLSGYSAGTGYDLATGLGSVNAANLVNAPAVWTSTTTASGDFTLSLSSPTVTVTGPGAPGTVTLTVAAEGGFTGTVTPTCSALPTLVTCTGSAVTGSGTTTITFATAASGKMVPTNRPNHFGSPTVRGTAALTCAFSMVLLLLGFWDRRRRLGMAFALTTFALLVGIVGCGGGSSSSSGSGSSTPAGTTTVLITGTSGTIQRSVAVTLTVN